DFLAAHASGGWFPIEGARRRLSADKSLMLRLISARQALLRDEPEHASASPEQFELDVSFLELAGLVISARLIEDSGVLPEVQKGTLGAIADQAALYSGLEALAIQIGTAYPAVGVQSVRRWFNEHEV